MEAVTFTIANELAAIPVVQAAATVYVRAAGIGDDVARQTELVIEEIVANIIQYEYLPGQHATIALTLSMFEGVLELLIRFRGVPFDVDYLRRCEKVPLPEIIKSGGRGMGLHLLVEFSDEVQYRNRGWQGQEIRIRRFIPEAGGRTAPWPAEAQREEEPPLAPLRITVRRMHPDEAATVSQLAYFSYHYTYFNEYIYEPEEVRRRNENGQIISYVAVNEENGALIGHVAVIPDDLSGMPELGAGFVDPSCRRSGGLNALLNSMVAELQKRGTPGTFGTLVTSHSYSQMSVVRLGMKETALFVSRLRPMAFQAITDQDVSRESLLYMVRLFDPSPRRPFYPPARHREMISKIIRHVNMTVSFADSPGKIKLPDAGEIEERTDANQTGHIVLRRWGSDSESRVRSLLRRWCLDRLETIYLYLPLCEPATAVFCPAFEEMQFFFAGLKPGRAGEDWLVLQFLNNQRYDYRLLKAATPFSRELIAYVRACDPVSKEERGVSV